MTQHFETQSPIDGSVVCVRDYATDSEIDGKLALARRVQAGWQATTISERARLCNAFVDAMLTERDEIAHEVTRQMGRPLSQSPGELRGFEERASRMIAIAEETLAPLQLPEKPGFDRFIERVPLGTVFTIAPWNYPFLTAVNSVVPALMAGNVVLLKHSAQTPLVAERFQQAFDRAGLPEGVFQYVHTTHEQTARIIGTGIDYVAFTGSVAGGRAVQRATGDHFPGIGLELGGKDPAYVRADADLDFAIDNLVDGSFFNSGQSCCGIERIYVDEAIFDRFVEGFVELTRRYRLGNPLEADTNLGPVVRPDAAKFVTAQIEEAKQQGARALIDPKQFPAHRENSAYLAPQVLVDVTHAMRVMTEESFGPVVGIMSVDRDERAIELMNDSDFGLTASVWTRDIEAAKRIGREVQTGTWFMNRCDYLDPDLAWTGVKDSGRGCTLSRIGYEVLTRPKSFHLRRR